MRRTGLHSCTRMEQGLIRRTSMMAYFVDMYSFGCALCHHSFPRYLLLFQSLRTIYTGKSSAFTGYRSASKPSQAEIHGMREVFPEAVAYAAVQVCSQIKSFWFILTL